jgi:hypothetical protein
VSPLPSWAVLTLAIAFAIVLTFLAFYGAAQLP